MGRGPRAILAHQKAETGEKVHVTKKDSSAGPEESKKELFVDLKSPGQTILWFQNQLAKKTRVGVRKTGPYKNVNAMDRTGIERKFQ